MTPVTKAASLCRHQATLTKVFMAVALLASLYCIGDVRASTSTTRIKSTCPSSRCSCYRPSRRSGLHAQCLSDVTTGGVPVLYPVKIITVDSGATTANSNNYLLHQRVGLLPNSSNSNSNSSGSSSSKNLKMSRGAAKLEREKPENTSASIASNSIDCLKSHDGSATWCEVISFRDANLKRVQEGAFANVTTIRVLDLSDNPLTDRTVAPRALDELAATLEVLLLSNCQLTRMPAALTQAHLSQLVVLHLDGNQLRSLPRRAFVAMTRLADLHLNGNRLTSIRSTVFVGLGSLHSLKLHDNALTSLHRATLRHLTNVTSLDLSRNNVTRLQSRLFCAMRHLEWLEVSHNGVLTVARSALRCNSQLKYLGLANNPLQFIADFAFRHNEHLRHLAIEVGHTTLTSRTLAGLERLEMLNLGELRRASLPEGLLAGLPRLRYLSLLDYEGHFTGLNVSIFAPTFDLARLNVWLTPLRPCSCDVPWMTSLAERGAYVHGYCVNQKPLSCVRSSPARQQQQQQRHIRRKQHRLNDGG